MRGGRIYHYRDAVMVTVTRLAATNPKFATLPERTTFPQIPTDLRILRVHFLRLTCSHSSITLDTLRDSDRYLCNIYCLYRMWPLSAQRSSFSPTAVCFSLTLFWGVRSSSDTLNLPSPVNRPNFKRIFQIDNPQCRGQCNGGCLSNWW